MPKADLGVILHLKSSKAEKIISPFPDILPRPPPPKAPPRTREHHSPYELPNF
jgi:hypothetical protein